MSAADSRGMQRLLVEAFRGFEGALLFGGTRMLDRVTGAVVPGITEAAPPIRLANPDSVALGVVPRTGAMAIGPDGLVVTDDPCDSYRTIIHPDQDLCLLVQEGVDSESSWDAEWQECLRITDDLRTMAGWASLLVAYNGGGVTEREILAVAAAGWPVLLLAESGRTASRLAADRDFLASHPSVRTAGSDLCSLRRALAGLGVVPEERP
mgnify:FL=1